MGLFIVGIILIVISLGIAVIGGFGAPTGGGKAGAIAGGFIGVIAGVAMLIGSFADSVPVKSIGVVTSFGKVTGQPLRPGIHWLAPWKHISILPETIQTTTFEGNSCLDVRIGGQQQACLDVTMQWQILDSAAATLFNNYNTSGTSVLDDITNAVVVRELKVAVNQVLGDYNPIADVAANSEAGNSQFSTFGPKIEAVMKRDIGSEIEIRTVLVPFLHYDSTTQARLNAIQQQIGATAIARQQILTNKALASANAAISTKALTPAALAAECYSLVQDAIKANYTLPAGFSCTGSTSAFALK